MSETEQEIINNRYEFIDWVYSQVIKKVHADFESERDQLNKYKNQLQEKYKSVSESLRTINGYVENIRKYEANLIKKEKTLQDRNNNFENIYNKMIQIESKLNGGEWPGVLPPLNLDLETEAEDH